MRGFEVVTAKEYLKKRTIQEYQEIKLPTRSTINAAGYDFYLPYELTLLPHESTIIHTGIKAYMPRNEFLMIVIRSSLGFKKGLRLKNQVGIIDSDYYNNMDNEGHILIAIENTSNQEVYLLKGDRVAQGIFLQYQTIDQEPEIENKREGGIGSTNRKNK